MDEKEVIQIVEICIPDSIWEHAVPGKAGAIFGKHLWVKTTEGLTDTYTPCGGNLRFEAVPPSERIIGLSYDEPIMIRCDSCNFSLQPFAGTWQEAVQEWRLIAYIAGLQLIQHSSYLRGQEQYVFDELNTFLPGNISFGEQLEGLLANKYDLWQKVSQQGTITGLPFWREHGLAVAYVTNIDKSWGLENLVVASGLLLKHMEHSFQKAIKRSHQLASSASEVFHPRSRRKRT